MTCTVCYSVLCCQIAAAKISLNITTYVNYEKYQKANQQFIANYPQGAPVVFMGDFITEFWPYQRPTFFSLKVAVIHDETIVTRETMRQTVFEYIQIDCNKTRRHSALGMCSHLKVSKKFDTKTQLFF